MAMIQEQFLTFWKRQSRNQQITFIVLLIAGITLIAVFTAWATTPTYSSAYRGLNEADAGQIVQKLKDNGIAYKLENNGTIMVQSDKVYEVRLMMAKEGLPQSNSVGYELFSGNTLGMTEFTQRVNYQRALEGELERTIKSIDAVQAVRVHIVTPEKRLLATNQEPATASITIQEKPGKGLTPDQVQSITHLVASAVEGLKPENVVVVDTSGNLLAAGTGQNKETALTSLTDSQRAIEKATAAEVQRKVQKFLDTVLGPNRSVVQTSVVMDWTRRETTSQTFNPTPAAVRSSQKINESYTTNGSVVGGIPGAGGNLPTPMPTISASGQPIVYTRSEETLNYEITKTDIKEIESPGKIAKLSVSVLVDGVNDPAQLETLKAAVAAAAGIDEKRGDSLILDTLGFDKTATQKQESEMQASRQTELYFQIGTAVAAFILIILLLWYISRLFKNLRLASSDAWMTVMKPVTQAALDSPSVSPMIGAGMSSPQSMASTSGTAAPQASPLPMPEPPAPIELPPLPTLQGMSPEEEQMQKVVSRLTEENPATVAEIIQLWLSEDEK